MIHPKPNPESSAPSDSSDPAAAGGSEKFDTACAEVLADAGAPNAGLRIEDATPEDPGPDFEKMVRVYLPKPFQIAAMLLEDDSIALSDLQREMLVPQGAMCLEELWPYLPEFFKNSRFKHTYAFLISLTLIAGENVVKAWKRATAKPQQTESVPPLSTATAA
jgi:hypothetical protein